MMIRLYGVEVNRHISFKHKTIILLFFIILFFLHSVCLADTVATDKKSIYDKGITYVKLSMFQEAKEQFQQIMDYSDSRNWNYYCLGMIEITSANELENQGFLSDAASHIEKASQYFGLLAGIQFEDSANIKTYCTARSYELKGLFQKSLDIYSTLLGTLDSDNRYLRLSTNILLPTQAPKKENPSLLVPIPAHARKSIESYFGPSSEYAIQRIVKISPEIPIFVCAREKEFYMLETNLEDGLIRFWAPTLRIQIDSDIDIHEINGTVTKKLVIQNAECFFGPGEEYMKAGVVLETGSFVNMIEKEEEYAQIEIIDKESNQSIRVWVLSDCLNK